MKKLATTWLVVAVSALAISAGTAGAQSEPSITADPETVDALGEASFAITGEGFTPGLDLFILPCVAPDGDLTAIDGQVDCDVDDLTPVTVDADGAFAADVGPYDVVDDFAIVAGDATNTEAAGVLITVEAAPASTTTTTEPAPTTTAAVSDDSTDTDDGELPETGAGTDLIIGGALAIAAAGVLATRGGQLLGRR